MFRLRLYIMGFNRGDAEISLRSAEIFSATLCVFSAPLRLCGGRSRSLYDLFLHGIPPDRALLAVALDRHAAGDGDAEPDLEGAVGPGGAADRIDALLSTESSVANRLFRMNRPPHWPCRGTPADDRPGLTGGKFRDLLA